MVLLVGLASAAMLFATTQLRESGILEDIARVQATGEIQTKVATSHLWLEEFVTGDKVEMDLIVGNLDSASVLVEEMLTGAVTPQVGEPIPPLNDPELRGQAEDIRTELDRFREISIERLLGYEVGEEVGIGSEFDIRYDRVFGVLFEKVGVLEMALQERRERNLARSRYTLWFVLSAWLALVAVAVTGLRTRERRRIRAERALRESEDRLFQAQKMQAVGRLAGGLAHDINNYLAAITSQCELVKLKAEPGSQVATKMETVISVAFKASRLIKRLLAFAKREPRQMEVVDLNEVVTELEPMMLRLIGEDVELQCDLQEPLWSVKLDPAHVEQLIVNLLVNAREAMPSGGRVLVETRNGTSRGRDEVQLTVRDFGLGIEEEIRSRIFEPFFTTKTTSSGAGLGLATVYGIVDQNEGWIEVESEVGKGTAFLIGLPRSLEEGPEKSLGRKQSRGAASGSLERVLYVEDNDELRSSISALLEGLGYRVYSASSGAEAVERFEQLRGAIDLLISDVVMPGMSGREVMERLRGQRPDLRVIFVSGYTGNVLNAHGVDDEEWDFLAKPFSARVLARMVREVLDRPARKMASTDSPPPPDSVEVAS